MTVESLNKRLVRLGDSASPLASLADSLDMARALYKARQDEWQAAGKTGRVPPQPLEPNPAVPRSRRLGPRPNAHGTSGLGGVLPPSPCGAYSPQRLIGGMFLVTETLRADRRRLQDRARDDHRRRQAGARRLTA